MRTLFIDIIMTVAAVTTAAIGIEIGNIAATIGGSIIVPFAVYCTYMDIIIFSKRK